MNFREELRKLEEGKIPVLTVEEKAEKFLSDLISVINQYKSNFEWDIDGLLFQLSGEGICVKRGVKYINNLYVSSNHFDSEKVFHHVKERLSEEGFEIKDENRMQFLVVFK